MTALAGTVAALACLGVSVLFILAVHSRAEEFRRAKTADAALRLVAQVRRKRLPAVLPNDDVMALQVINAEGQMVAATKNLIGKPLMSTFRPRENSTYASKTLCHPHGLHGCMIVVSFRVYEDDGDWFVYAADRTTPWYTDEKLVLFLVGMSLLLVLLTAVGAFRTVSRTLAPVEAIRAELAEISGRHLHRRVPVPENRDEIRLLAETANATLDRMEEALEQQRRFSSDASHDLRSPLAAMRTQVEAALLDPEETDWPAAGRAILASLDRLQAIVSDLLMLSKLDAGAPQARDLLDLGRTVQAELERRPRGKRVETDLQPGVTVRGDVLRLGRLLTNLLDNAERHAVETIRVTVRAEDGWAVLEVLDDGAGIAPEHREVVFHRFSRLDAARSKDGGGTGLGLAIAREIAEAHHGRLTIEDSDRGARFVLRLPAIRELYSP